MAGKSWPDREEEKPLQSIENKKGDNWHVPGTEPCIY